eukprot:TRINITY_DN7474_c0_g1_i3.p1 TRINITY_DN7474_c0_g1~~TRINITY_DN7474_c0_g1_i3.p1  ORF type:complete len:301 (-),score=13.05 TRINITY_DN7474_c0_g1_i3:771-1673(-)
MNSLKQAVTSSPILRHPDLSRLFELHTAWGKPGIGVVLSQRDDKGDEYVIAYASQSNYKAESNYSSYEGECLAIVWAVAQFRHHLDGKELLICTDHQPLEWLMKSDKLSRKLAWCAQILQEYEFKMEYRAGLKNMNADVVSKNPLPAIVDTGTRQDHDPPDLGTGSSHQARAAKSTPSPCAGFVTVSPAGFAAAAAKAPVTSDDYSEYDQDEWGPAELLFWAVREVNARPPASHYPTISAVHVEPIEAWDNESLLLYLRHDSYPDHATTAEKNRVLKCSCNYVWRNDTLIRVFPGGKIFI